MRATLSLGTSPTEPGAARFRPPAIRELLDRLGSTLGVERVFGEPVERDGVVIIPAARIRGGGGGGGGGGQNVGGEEGAGEGVELGVSARPVGAFVVSGGTVAWKPAVDVTALVAVWVVTSVTYLVVRWLIRRTEARVSVRSAVRAD